MNVNLKYLKDEDGNAISPITSTNSVYDSTGTSVNEILNNTYKVIPLYDASDATCTLSSSSSTTLTLSDCPMFGTYDMISISYQSCDNSNGRSVYDTQFLMFSDNATQLVYFNTIIYIGSTYLYVVRFTAQFQKSSTSVIFSAVTSFTMPAGSTFDSIVYILKINGYGL